MENKNVLIIDDDPGVRQAYIQILSPKMLDQNLGIKGASLFGPSKETTTDIRDGFSLTIAENGTEGIEAVRTALDESRHYAAAFIDMKMPGLDGAETAKRIWAIDPNIKIAIITAYSEKSPEEITQMVGRKDLLYLRKPFNSEEIRQLAVALTQHWNVEQERNVSNRRLQKAHAKLNAMNKTLQSKIQKQAAQLVHSEKMSSVGILAAGVAHEINTPLAYIKTNMETMKSYTIRLHDLLNFIKGRGK